MYESYYGLRAKPFELHPDPAYLYMSPTHDDVYTHLRYAAKEGSGFVVITGEIGSGKTTLLHYLLRRISQSREVLMLNNTSVSPGEFLQLLCQGFHLEPEGRGKAKLLEALGRHLLERRRAGRRVVLIVDEAQNLPADTVEEIRLLSNLEAEKGQLFQTVLVGQPELRDKLRRRELEQFLQRVTVHCHLTRMERTHVKRYVQHRLRVAGAQRTGIFDEEAMEAVYRHSRGIPRLINILCDTALVFGFGEQQRTIGRSLVEDVVESRVAGGLFSEIPEEGKDAAKPNPEVPPAGPASHPVQGSADAGKSVAPAEEERLQFLEARIRALEEAVDAMGPKVEILGISDRQLVEMLRTLKREISGRRQTVRPASRGKGGAGEETAEKRPGRLRILGAGEPQGE